MGIQGYYHRVQFIIICIVTVLTIESCVQTSDVRIIAPFDQSVFPPEFPAPTFYWESTDSSNWEINLSTAKKNFTIYSSTSETSWKPSEDRWDSLKAMSDYKEIIFSIRKSGIDNRAQKISFNISRDTVGAPILYRQMPIPSLLAERQLDSMSYKLLDVGSKDPPHISMKGFPVCGNCHSLTADGGTIALDLDAGTRDKGGFFIAEVDDTVRFNIDNYLSWSKMEKRRTFGLFSKISPDGRYIVTTVKDRVVFYNYPATSLENVVYSQLFFPINGYLAIYDRKSKTLKELPGANLDEYVQSNAIWTPDGKNIVFSRAKAIPRTDIDEYVVQDDSLISLFVNRKKTIQFDICTIPFNDGKGGEAVLIEGASNNGKSNFFPAISPDGKWLVYCQAESFMLLMPDSRLYIVPVEGGRASYLDTNLHSMNSWHAWSPNGKWLVFVSKGLSPYTDMFLTHIDENGKSSKPVLVEKAREFERVVNYPEFVNRDPAKPITMDYDYVELKHLRSALNKGEREKAIQLYYRLKSQDPFFFPEDYQVLEMILKRLGLEEEAKLYSDLATSSLKL